MGRNNAITEKQFNAIKIMLNAGTKTNDIVNCMEISEATVRRVRDASDFEDYVYQRRNPQPHAPQGPAVPEAQVRHTVEIQATHYMMQELKEQTRLLNLISAKMAAIIDDLYGTGGKAHETDL